MCAPRTWKHLSDASQAQFWACLALKYVKGLGVRQALSLVRYFGSALEAVQHAARWEEAGIPVKFTDALHKGTWRAKALVEWQSAQRCAADIILWGEEGYPPRLRHLSDAPLILYAQGDRRLLSSPCVAIVGSRDCTQAGIQLAASISAGLARAGVCVISGMAMGIDRAAHAAALHEVGKSIGVLGTGITLTYPQCNAALFRRMLHAGLLLSEFAPESKAYPAHFPIRNRIISGLSLGVLVVEAAMRSGSLITARLALEQNRNVYAIPGPASAAASLGCQELIRQGAQPIFNAEDVLRDLLPLLKEFYPQQATDIADAQALPVRRVADGKVVAAKTLPSAGTKRAAGMAQAEEPSFCEAMPQLAPRAEGRGTFAHVALRAEDGQAALSGQGACRPFVGAAASDSFFSAEESSFTPSHTAVLTALAVDEPRHVDAVCVATAQPASAVNALLIELEVWGMVRRWPGGLFTREQ